ncbi:MAG TPA: efflux RND transporter periplasmic adaptor subunit [Thermoanaerobaculia bacterium]
MNPQRLKILLPVAFVALAIIIAVVLVRARPVAEREERTIDPPLVRVMAVQHRNVATEIVSQGTVRSHAETTLAAQVGGKIEAIAASFREGGTFGRGEVLARLDTRDHEAALAQAEATVAQARLRLARESAEAQIAREEWQRMGQGAEPSALVLREPQLADARAALNAAQASASQARLNIERASIRAPYDGVLLRKDTDIGQFVAPGTPLALVASSAFAEIELPVSSSDLEHIDIAATPRVTLRGASGGGHWEGRIVRAGGQIDPATRMLPMIARVERPFTPSAGRQPLRIGEFVAASITGRTAGSVVVIPRGALRGRDRVLIVDSANRLHFRPVSVLRLTEREALINSGLADGERVILSQLETPVEGMLVRTTADDPGDGMRVVPVTETAR